MMAPAMTTLPSEIGSEPLLAGAGRRLSHRPPPARTSDCKELLRRAGLRPTRQRLALASLLFGSGNRHVTAEMLHAEAITADIPVSLATVYNTLNQLTKVGLLRQIGMDGSKSFFDTNPSEHHHFFLEGERTIVDTPAEVVLDALPTVPVGLEIARIDVIVRLRRKADRVKA
jgi:Fur family transcriptional regulator, iron response regulator